MDGEVEARNEKKIEKTGGKTERKALRSTQTSVISPTQGYPSEMQMKLPQQN